ncbi:MAG TPA: hypothetical protein PLK94_15045, partial [Alphaproteobacteria bacterium]|nr:hypothetical protein [Alphaproteobacteria bacterium]
PRLKPHFFVLFCLRPHKKILKNELSFLSVRRTSFGVRVTCEIVVIAYSYFGMMAFCDSQESELKNERF